MSRDLLSYFGLTYLITWLFTIPFVVLWRTSLHQTLPWWVVVFLPGASWAEHRRLDSRWAPRRTPRGG
jgi:hypothetical protein